VGGVVRLKNQFSSRIVRMIYPMTGKTAVLVLCAIIILYTTFSNINSLIGSSHPVDPEGYVGGGGANQYKLHGWSRATGTRYANPSILLTNGNAVYLQYTRGGRIHHSAVPWNHVKQLPISVLKQMNVKVRDEKTGWIPAETVLGPPQSYANRMLDKKISSVSKQSEHAVSSANSNTNKMSELTGNLNVAQTDLNGIYGR